MKSKRLEELENEIEFFENDEMSKKILAITNKSDQEKLELMSALVPVTEAGKANVVTGVKNAFVYEDGDRMEQINDELKTKFLALPPCSTDEDNLQADSIHDDTSSMKNMQSSVFGDESKKGVDMFSERSVQLTQISK
jgi:GTPase involved in cell partitioning and DNA repair